jgi:hypothetical protein
VEEAPAKKQPKLAATPPKSAKPANKSRQNSVSSSPRSTPKASSPPPPPESPKSRPKKRDEVVSKQKTPVVGMAENPAIVRLKQEERPSGVKKPANAKSKPEEGSVKVGDHWQMIYDLLSVCNSYHKLSLCE